MLDDLFAAVQPSVLRDQVASAIREAVASGGLRSGTRLVESEIADRMGVSKAPVREALRLLEAEGLVQTLPHRGSFVTRLSGADMREVFNVRGALERMAIGLLIDQKDAARVEELRSILESMLKAEKELDAKALRAADLAFHEVIVRGSGSRRVKRLWMEMQGLIQMYFTQKEIDGSRPLSTTSRHEAIFNAIEQGDRTLAQDTLERHLMEAGVEVERWAARLE